jgi:hypothetical protein
MPTIDSHYVWNIKNIKFDFEGQKYAFVAVPMGLSSACRFFTKIMKAPLSFLRAKHDITITGYIDDMFLVDSSKQSCAQAVLAASDIF